MHLTQPLRTRVAGALLCAGALLGVTGCAATVTARPTRSAVLYDYPVVYVARAPVRVYERPSVLYRGSPAYLVDGRWYYRSERGWLYFRDDPAELQRARAGYVQRRARAHPPRRRRLEERHERGRYVEEPRERSRRRYD